MQASVRDRSLWLCRRREPAVEGRFGVDRAVAHRDGTAIAPGYRAHMAAVAHGGVVGTEGRDVSGSIEHYGVAIVGVAENTLYPATAVGVGEGRIGQVEAGVEKCPASTPRPV